MKSISKVLDDTAVLLQKYVRLKDYSDNGGYCTCVTCGKTGHWKEMDGGHWISRVWTKHKINENNLHVQCKGCNRFSSRIAEQYTMYMIDTYGEDVVRDMIATKRDVTKYDRQDLMDMQKDLKAKIKELLNEC